MDEVERIERQRWAYFVLESALGFGLIYFWTRSGLIAATLACGLGLLFSGVHLARQLTRDPAWAYLVADGRITGIEPSRRGIWIGNILPGFIVLAVGIWLVLD